MGGKSRLASLLHEFIPASDAFVVSEAIKRVFDKNGDRKNKHLARLRFLVEKIGLPKFRELYESRTGRVARQQSLAAGIASAAATRHATAERRSQK